MHLAGRTRDRGLGRVPTCERADVERSRKLAAARSRVAFGPRDPWRANYRWRWIRVYGRPSNQVLGGAGATGFERRPTSRHAKRRRPSEAAIATASPATPDTTRA